MTTGDPLGRRDLADAYDLAIIGFGPAGAALALAVARGGARVVILEQHRVPHDKLCGEFLSPDAIASLDALGVPLDAVEAPPIDRVRITAPDGALVERPLPEAGCGLTRLALDRTLAGACRAAGVEIREQWRASEVGRAASGGAPEVVIAGVGPDGKLARVCARVAAGAFGKGGLRDPAAAPHRGAARGRFLAWKQHFAGGEALAPGQRGVVELFAFPGGYCGVSPIEGGSWNVCGIATRSAWEGAGGSIGGLIDRAARANPLLARRLQGLTAASKPLTVARLDFTRRQPVAAPLLQLGDAAAEIAPLAGDGIAMALRSAAIAHPLVEARLGGGIDTRAMLAEYRRAWRRAFSRRLAIASVLQRLLLDARSAGAAVRLLAVAPPIADWLVRATRDPQRPALAGGRARGAVRPAACAVTAMLLGAALAFPACQRRENPPPPRPRAAKPMQDPADSTVAGGIAGKQQGDPMAIALARRVVRSMGGEEAWKGSRCIYFTIVDGDSTGKERSRHTHCWDRATGRHRLEGIDRAARPFVVVHTLGDSAGAIAEVAGKPISDPAALDRLRRQAEAMWQTDSDWLLMPWRLIEPEARLTYGGTVSEEGKTWDVVEVAFGDSTDAGSIRRYAAYVDRETGTVDRTARITSGARGRTTREVFDWQNWQRYGDILLADRRRAVRGSQRILFPALAVFDSCPEAAFTVAAPVTLPAL